MNKYKYIITVPNSLFNWNGDTRALLIQKATSLKEARRIWGNPAGKLIYKLIA